MFVTSICVYLTGLVFRPCSLLTVSANPLSSLIYMVPSISGGYTGFMKYSFLYYVGENTVSTLGRFVLLIWLFVVLIINSSYTASLTSILTVQQLSSPVKGIDSLINSKEPIGYLQGSFTRTYLIEEIGIDESRLVPLKTPEETAKALKNGPHKGGVAAYVDERAYIELFLSSRCDFSIVGQEFTRNGWGFVSISLQ